MPALAAALLLATLVVSACTGPAPVPLPVASPSPALPRTAPAPTPDPARLAFETLDRAEFMHRIDLVRISEGQVIAAWSADQAAGLATHVVPDARANLLATDFATHFLIGVFRGTERGTNYPVTIRQIRYEEDTITVHADFGSPGRGPSGALGTDPYHVVRVQRPPQMPGQPPVVLRIARVTPTPPGGPPPTIAVTGTPYDPPLPQSPKIHPSLAQQWAVTGPTEQLRLLIWITGPNARPAEALFPILAERYPEARAAMDRRRLPFDVDDPALAARIRQDYEQMLREDIQKRNQPLIDELRARGLQVTELSSLPSIAVIAPKSVVIELLNHPLVESIYAD